MLLSLLTPSFNQAAFIEQNIRSALHQDYPAFEHIVVDAASTDATVSILRRYPHLRWVSEPDRGQADALNKAFAMSTGDVIGWINSDDYYEPGVFSDVARRFEDPAVQWVVGGLTRVHEPSGRRTARPSPAVTFEALLRDPDIVRQPAAFFRRSALLAAGPWDPALHMVMDLDLWLRVARLAPPVITGTPYACFRTHAAQKTSLANMDLQRREILRVLERYGAPPSTLRRLSLRKRWFHFKAAGRAVLEHTRLLAPRQA